MTIASFSGRKYEHATYGYSLLASESLCQFAFSFLNLNLITIQYHAQQ